MNVELTKSEIELTRWCIAKLWLNVDLKTNKMKYEVNELYLKFKSLEDEIK